MNTIVRNALTLLGVGALSFGLASPVQSQDFKSALPEGTVVYIGAPDLPTAIETFKTSALFKMWREEEVQEFFEGLLEEANKQWTQGMAQAKEMHKAGVIPVDPEEILKVKVQGFHMALTELSLDMQTGPKLNLCVCIDFGQSADKIKAMLAVLLNMAKAQAGADMPELVVTKLEGAQMSSLTPPEVMPMMPKGFGIHWSFVGGKLVIGTSQDAMKDIIQGLAKGGLEKNLTTAAAYTAVAAKTRPQPHGFEAFIRPDSIWEALWAGLAMAKQMDPDNFGEVDIDGVKRAIDALGLLDTKAMGVASAYEGGKGVDRWFAKTEGEPKGLMKMVGDGDIDQAQLDLIPKDVSNFSIARLEPSALYDSVFAAVNAYNEDLGAMVKMQVDQAQEQIGINFREDFFANIGPEMVMYSMPVSGNQLPEMGIMVKVKDPAKALKVIQTAAAMSEGLFGISEIEVEGGKLYGVDMELPDQMAALTALVEPTFTFHKGYLILGFNRSDVRGALKMLNGTGGATVKENKAFATYLETIPAKVTSLSWRDTAAEFEGVYGVVASAAGLIPLPEEIPIDLGLLPSTETLTQHLFGSLTYSKRLPDGYMTKMVGPVGPELYLLLGVGVAAIVPAMIALRSQGALPFPGGAGGKFRAPMPAADAAVLEVEATAPEPVLQDPEKKK